MPGLPARLLLALGAGLALVLALAILFLPGPFYGAYGIDPSGQPALLSELKSPALVILALGLAMAAGAVLRDWVGRGLLAGMLLYLGFGLSRLASLLLDGAPPVALVSAMLVELVLGAAFALLLWRHRRSPTG